MPPSIKNPYYLPGQKAPKGSPASKKNISFPSKKSPKGGGGGGGSTPGYGYSSGNYGAANAAAAAAAQAEAERQAKARRQIGISLSGIRGGGNASLNNLVNSYNNQTLSFLRGTDTGQTNINTGRTNNALNTRRALNTIRSDVRQGKRNLGTELANRNASDSGAALAGAQAWARQGNRQTVSARNQAALKGSEIDIDQRRVDQERHDTLEQLRNYRKFEVERIGNSLMNKLQILNEQAEDAGLGEMVKGQLRDEMIDNAMKRLQRIDKLRDTRLAKLTPLTPEEIERRAVEADQAGTQGEMPFEMEPVDWNIDAEGAPDEGAPLSSLLPFRGEEDELGPVPVPAYDPDDPLLEEQI